MSSDNITNNWFMLMDSAAGKPFKGTSATRVSLASTAIVDDFRVAVKVVFANKLSFIDAPDLVVYQNKAAFDSRNSVEGLKSSDFMNILGRTEEDVVIVVVPSPSVSLFRGDEMQIDTSPTTSDSSHSPRGEEVDLSKPQKILAFLETQMNNPAKLFVSCRILPEERRKIELSGREAAIAQILLEERAIPVASGLSGLGKTRLLEEWETIFDQADIVGPRFGVIIPYLNGKRPHPVEKRMKIEASFSWRLLYRVFIEGNGKGFADWFNDCLPANGAGLTLDTALKVIRLKVVSLGLIGEKDMFHLFLGVDEFQSVDDVSGIPFCKGPRLLDLTKAIASIVAEPVVGVRIYPMFAVSNLSCISSCDSTMPHFARLRMPLLSNVEMERSIESIPCGVDLLKQAAVRRHLFYLGGVPSWFTEYVLLLVEKVSTREDKIPTVEEAGDAFKSINGKYIKEWGKIEEDGKYKTLEPIDFIKLAAFAFANEKVELEDQDIGSINWSRLRDSSVCLIDDDGRVSIPYAIIHRIASYRSAKFNDPAVRCFTECVKGLVQKVDEQIYDKPSWQLWEVFGAYFHALRINAFQIIGYDTVKVADLFKGALINGCDQEFKLRPMRVMETEDEISKELGPIIRRKGHVNERHNYLEEGIVVVNGENGKGVDIFFALETTNASYICINDQRKYDSTQLAIKSISNLLKKASIKPNIPNITVIPCLFSCFTDPKVESTDLQPNSIVVTYPQSMAYHGSLFIHPASSPVININNTSMTQLKNLLQCTNAAEAARVIVARAKSKPYDSIEDLSKDLQELGVSLREGENKRIVSK